MNNKPPRLRYMESIRDSAADCDVEWVESRIEAVHGFGWQITTLIKDDEVPPMSLKDQLELELQRDRSERRIETGIVLAVVLVIALFVWIFF